MKIFDISRNTGVIQDAVNAVSDPQLVFKRLNMDICSPVVDRLGDDYPVLAAPGQPGLRVNTSIDEIIRYAPKFMDVINLDEGRIETVKVEDVLREWVVSAYKEADIFVFGSLIECSPLDLFSL